MASQQTLHPDRTDELLTSLADTKRRAILTHLKESPDDVATVQTLTDELRRHPKLGDDLTGVELVHSDLPRLDSAGVIEFDHRSETARYQADERVEGLLDVIADL